ncbi:NAD-dependent epimerase/dehydratase family protein [Methylobacterium isbiliense]|jgi:nucleoside-diphosphate-sugar epimerase|uniref:ADP-L-glycero-D-manno-heptose-6-epimerase n=1 Tax=Methylobacterium isbiliense TaxID=315478 RepID=A0ABQ4SEP5_9HYPH|nr:SDR family oxidoreductase [Methylobacterium isbiliense]MDN3627478.1 SDR family oxidoreductase [Methylobacterium isbiliense]GJE01706.1 ADP-L-glycero-D-manno-heptose-6-epimerase [Methylobacterium isbiliense]
MRRKIAVTGAGGYIGSVLIQRLLETNSCIKAVDMFFFGETPLSRHRTHPSLELIRQDIRTIEPDIFEDCDCVIDLAALSNDPSGDLDPELTRSINERGRMRVAMAAERAGVRRYLFASSCAVYGAGQDMHLSEEAPLRPLTVYAQTCARAEEAVLARNGARFTTAALRNATVFGLSPRMRFDLVVNQMTLDAHARGRITVAGDGTQWRPLVHVRDVAEAFLLALRAPRQAIGGHAFNIGAENRQVIDIARAVKRAVAAPSLITFAPGGPDRRDYHVAFAKAERSFGFTAGLTIGEAVVEIAAAIRAKRLSDTPACHTVRWYRDLLSRPGHGLRLPDALPAETFLPAAATA